VFSSFCIICAFNCLLSCIFQRVPTWMVLYSLLCWCAFKNLLTLLTHSIVFKMQFLNSRRFIYWQLEINYSSLLYRHAVACGTHVVAMKYSCNNNNMDHAWGIDGRQCTVWTVCRSWGRPTSSTYLMTQLYRTWNTWCSSSFFLSVRPTVKWLKLSSKSPSNSYIVVGLPDQNRFPKSDQVTINGGGVHV